MFQLVLLVLTCYFLVDLGSSVTCGTNSIGIDWTGSSSSASGGNSGDLSFQTPYTTSDCDEDVCTAASYDIDYELTVNNFLGFDWWDFSIETSFSLDAAFCGNDDICQALAGGTDNCHAINFDFSQWFPTSCDNSSDYDATTAKYNITYKYGCCSSDDCNENYDFSSCEYNNELGNYVSELYECWNGVRKDFMKYLICDNSGNTIFDFDGNCRDSGDWINDENCTYIITCSDTIQTILTNFGECACHVATENDFPGLVIAEIMETQWNSYCPNINLTCSSDDGELVILLTKVYVYWTFYLDIDISELTDDIRDIILKAVSNAGNILNTLVAIIDEAEGDTSDGERRRRRLGDTTTLTSTDGSTITIQIEVETEDDASSIETNLNGNADDKVSSTSGYTATGGEASTSQETELVAGTSNSDDDSGDGDSDEFPSVIIACGALVVGLIIVLIYIRNEKIKKLENDGESKQARLLNA